MDNRTQSPPASGMALDDIYFVLFRHKWKIILLFIAGVLAAGIIYRIKPPEYQSEAELIIKYVLDNTSPSPAQHDHDSHMQSTDPEGLSIINSEMQILKSLDVAKKVAEDIGPDKILAKLGGGHDLMQAAGFINRHLHVTSLAKSSVIAVDFSHPDPNIVQPVLSQIISEYKKKHIEVHQPGGTYYDFFTKTTDDLKNDLGHIETELRSARTNVGVISLDDASKRYAKEIEKTSQDILDAEAELASYTVLINTMTSLSFGKPVATNANTNLASKPEPPVPAAVTEQYVRISKRLTALWAKDEDFDRQGFLEGSTLRVNNRAEIEQAKTEKQKLEAENPGLKLAGSQVLSAQASPSPGQAPSSDPSLSLSNQAIQIAKLQSKIDHLKATLDDLNGKAEKIADAQPQVSELERRKKEAEESLDYYQKALNGARASDVLGAGKAAPNITTVQEPSPPAQDWSKRYKAMGMLIFAGLAGGLAWAFLIEFYLDTSIKRPKEIKTKLGMPLFLSIPDTNKGGRRRRALSNGRLLLKDADSATTAAVANGSPEATANLEIAPWDPNHSLRPFYEALRDRLLGYFEAKNLTHNPKLVAVTGAGKGSGATTLAMGLAASLSETGDGNVLLVDMNLEHGAAQHFYKGKPHCGLDDVLENGNRQTALVQENLYVVSANSNGDHLPRILPKRFASLVPKFKASDFDYIIFDMPPISQTSITLRLAGFMDTALLVVESEKTSRNAVMEACSLLAEAKANVNVVLNKTRSYIPARLHEEF